jgi:hypothetical protein
MTLVIEDCLKTVKPGNPETPPPCGHLPFQGRDSIRFPLSEREGARG